LDLSSKHYHGNNTAKQKAPRFDPGVDAGKCSIDVTSTASLIAPGSTYVAGGAGWPACPSAAANLARQIWKLAADTASSRQKAAMLAALSMPLQTATPGHLFRGVRFQLAHIRLRII